jgi:primosomal protein N'
LGERFRHELMTAMGLTPTALDGIWQQEIAELALAAATVLRRQARNRLALSTELRFVESNLRQALEQGQDAIAARHDGDGHALALLRELAAEIGRRIPALMLLPEAGLIERLIFALEEAHAEDRLSDEEHLLLSRLQKLKGDLERMNPKDASAWRSIARQLERLAEPAVSPTHAAEDGKHH